MGREKRQSKRHSIVFNATLYLCEGHNGPPKSKPIHCQIINLSRHGAGLITSQIIVDNQHLFFASLDSDDSILHLQLEIPKSDDSSASLTLAVRPVWFDRILDREPKPFKIGVEFFEKISNDDFVLIKTSQSQVDDPKTRKALP